MGFNAKNCPCCGSFLPRKPNEEMVVECRKCHEGFGICSICGDIQHPQILHPWGRDKVTGKLIRVCCGKCYDETEKKFNINGGTWNMMKDTVNP